MRQACVCQGIRCVAAEAWNQIAAALKQAVVNMLCTVSFLSSGAMIDFPATNSVQATVKLEQRAQGLLAENDTLERCTCSFGLGCKSFSFATVQASVTKWVWGPVGMHRLEENRSMRL